MEFLIVLLFLGAIILGIVYVRNKDMQEDYPTLGRWGLTIALVGIVYLTYLLGTTSEKEDEARSFILTQQTRWSENQECLSKYDSDGDWLNGCIVPYMQFLSDTYNVNDK